MHLGRARLSLLVEEAAEIHVRVGVVRLELDGAAVRVARVGGGGRLDVAAEAVPVLGAQPLPVLPRLLGGALRERSGRGREVGDGEVEERLPGFGVPGSGAVLHDDALAVGGDADAGERPAVGKLAAKLLQRAPHRGRRGPSRRRDPSRCAEGRGPGSRSAGRGRPRGPSIPPRPSRARERRPASRRRRAQRSHSRAAWRALQPRDAFFPLPRP